MVLLLYILTVKIFFRRIYLMGQIFTCLPYKPA